jgi:hypothetical protein
MLRLFEFGAGWLSAASSGAQKQLQRHAGRHTTVCIACMRRHMSQGLGPGNLAVLHAIHLLELARTCCSVHVIILLQSESPTAAARPPCNVD